MDYKIRSDFFELSMINVVRPISCSICTEELAGEEVVNHGLGAHPQHAIHRECFKQWQRVHPNEQLNCLFRCNRYAFYEDKAWDLVAALRPRKCGICHLILDDPQPHLGPIINHGGDLGLQHRVHRECIRRLHLDNGSLDCPQHRECLTKFRADAVFSQVERDVFLRREKIIGLIGSVALGALLMLGFCFILVNIYKIVRKLEPFIDGQLIPNIKFHTNLMQGDAELIGWFTPITVLGVINVVSFMSLTELIEKISGYITKKQFLARQVLEVTIKGSVCIGFAALLIGSNLGVSTVSGFTLTAVLISGAVNGIFYAWKNREARFGF